MANFSDLQRGMNVFIDEECRETAKRFGLEYSRKRSMRGKWFRISKVDDLERKIVIDNFHFDARDLSITEPIKELNTPPILFDPSYLDCER